MNRALIDLGLMCLMVTNVLMCFLTGFENFHGSIDPEELFRNIFGQAGFKMGGFEDFTDFEESKYGFAPATEVRIINDL